MFSLDAMKAIDHLELNYLWSVLEHMGLVSSFINMIKVLYSNPRAVFLTGQVCSQFLFLERETQQGCPRSPLLFALSVDPLTQAIQQSELISPFTIRNTFHHISWY